MLFNFINKAKKSFTLLEVLIICGAFSIVIVSIIGAINRAYAFMNNTRLQVRAVNFAREGMEMMFNIRDTNWRENSGDKNKHWDDLGGGEKFGEGIYVLKEGENGSGDVFFYAEKLDVDENFYGDDFWKSKSEDRDKARITFSGTYNYLTGKYESGGRKFEPTTGNVKDLFGNGAEFYRIVRVYYIDVKSDDCANPEDCPKEMCFCVKVFYRGNGEHSTELCSMMTNFEE